MTKCYGKREQSRIVEERRKQWLWFWIGWPGKTSLKPGNLRKVLKEVRDLSLQIKWRGGFQIDGEARAKVWSRASIVLDHKDEGRMLTGDNSSRSWWPFTRALSFPWRGLRSYCRVLDRGVTWSDMFSKDRVLWLHFGGHYIRSIKSLYSRWEIMAWWCLQQWIWWAVVRY